MTSVKQFEANRRNSLKSTGPKTEAGKQAARCNAVRHGLTAETVIGGLEDAEDYKAFEAAITADYDAQSAVERELVLRLATAGNDHRDRPSTVPTRVATQSRRAMSIVSIAAQFGGWRRCAQDPLPSINPQMSHEDRVRREVHWTPIVVH